jgi:hypothetical protein
MHSLETTNQEKETMKHLIVAGIFAVSTSAAFAEPFEYQKRFGGPEYDPYESTAGMSFAPVVKSGKTASLSTWMLEGDVEGVAPNDYRGTIIESGPSRISLYEIQRDSPEGIAYSDYHERYAADTDWDAVAREFRQSRLNQGLVSGVDLQGGDS